MRDKSDILVESVTTACDCAERRALESCKSFDEPQF